MENELILMQRDDCSPYTFPFETSKRQHIETPRENTTSYIIEPARRGADGLPIDPRAEVRVVREETFVPACDGILDLNSRGEVIYKVCFAPGTLVHTHQGLVPIQNIRVGMQVLAQPEQGGPRAWRSVVNTVAHLDQQVYAVQVNVPGAQVLTTLITTANHPFWVQGHDWVAAESLEPGHVLQLQDGSSAIVHGAGLVRRTQHAHIGFAADDRVGLGLVLDLSDGQIQPASDALALRLPELTLGEPCLSPVYNFEVDEFHTYYVGEVGVWVHNTNCTETVASREVAIESGIIKQEARETLGDTCFAEGTLVHTKEGLKPIEEIKVGDWVLTYPDDMAPPKRAQAPFRLEEEYFYRQVTKTFVHEDAPILNVKYLHLGGGYVAGPLRVTPNHPVYSEGRGWIPASELSFGHSLVERGFGNLLVAKVKNTGETARVYNLEVDEFHTYFVEELGIWVHNKHVGGLPHIVEIPVIREAVTRERIFENPNYRNDATVDSRANTGRLSEEIAQPAIEASTGIDFNAEIRNASNNGPDLFAIIHADAANGIPGQIVCLDVKGSLASNYPSVAQLALSAKTLRWITEGKDGTLNGQPISAFAQLQFLEAYDLLQGNPRYEIVTGIVEVHIPRAGTTGLLTIDYVPNPRGYQEVTFEGTETSTNLLTDADIARELTTAKQYWLDAGISAGVFANMTVSIDTLATRTAGQTEGRAITIDADGAGWGWFVDGTPAEQSEFGASGSASVFQAAAASEAANKLDLLSVLVHELGHVLGLNHTPGAADSLSATITPGQRRLPDAADIAALQAALAAAGAHSITTHVGASAAPSTLTLAAPPAGWVAGQPTEGYGQLWAAMTAINPTLANGSFATI
jgi:hypothetical protein